MNEETNLRKSIDVSVDYVLDRLTKVSPEDRLALVLEHFDHLFVPTDIVEIDWYDKTFNKTTRHLQISKNL